MPSDTHYFLLTALLGLPLEAPAITVHRCESASGHLTFTTRGCASADTQSLQEVHTYLPGTMVPLMPEADARQPAYTRRAPTIVGQAQDTCGNLINARQRREGNINQRVVAGMSQQDVESALGKPDKVTVRNSATIYRYDNQRGRSAHVEFDEKGCVSGKAKSRTAKSPR
ncbi:cell envelope protein SmpA [Pseudomonas sp. S2_C03]